MILLDRLRILLSHTRRGLRAECPAGCAEGHTFELPCSYRRAANDRNRSSR